MTVEIHAIQSFAPANLNRDDTGAPKQCEFGGVTRARVSSQSWKRAVRMAFREDPSIELGVRTKRAHRQIAELIQAADTAVDAEVARHRAAVVLEAEPLGLSLRVDEDDLAVKTGQLLFLRRSDLEQLATIAVQHGSELDELLSSVTTEKAKRAVLSKTLVKTVEQALTTPGAALDVALFGRMLAEMPEANVDAACQVAHALGTHRLAAESDYYTAVDDLKEADTEGADMIGDIQFNASCFYRYAAIDVGQLGVNLGPAADEQHLQAAVAAFTRAFVTAAPTGKQATFAARNVPAAVLAVRRSQGAMNLANAFVDPVRVGGDGIPSASTDRLLDEYQQLERMYGARDGSTKAMLLSRAAAPEGPWERAEHLDDLVAFASHG